MNNLKTIQDFSRTPENTQGQRKKLFVNVQLHCNVSNPEKIAKCRSCLLLGNFLRTPMATFTLSASFDVWASQAMLTMYVIEIIQNVS